MPAVLPQRPHAPTRTPTATLSQQEAVFLLLSVVLLYLYHTLLRLLSTRVATAKSASPRGLSSVEISQSTDLLPLPAAIDLASDVCAICLNGCALSEELRCLPCAHIFHQGTFAFPIVPFQKAFQNRPLHFLTPFQNA